MSNLSSSTIYKIESNQRFNGTKPPKGTMDPTVQNASPFLLGHTCHRTRNPGECRKGLDIPRAHRGTSRLSGPEQSLESTGWPKRRCLGRAESGLSPNKQIKPKEWGEEAHSTNPGKKEEAKVEKQPQRKKSISWPNRGQWATEGHDPRQKPFTPSCKIIVCVCSTRGSLGPVNTVYRDPTLPYPSTHPMGVPDREGPGCSVQMV